MILRAHPRTAAVSVPTRAAFAGEIAIIRKSRQLTQSAYRLLPATRAGPSTSSPIARRHGVRGGIDVTSSQATGRPTAVSREIRHQNIPLNAESPSAVEREGLSVLGVKKGLSFQLAICRPGGDRLSRVLRRSIMGAGAFHGRVRNGIGCGRPARTTRSANGKLEAGLERAL